MKKKTYWILTIIFASIALLGLISFCGGIRPVNIGAFVFPLVLAVLSFAGYKRKK